LKGHILDDLPGHGRKEKAERRFHIFPIDTVGFLVRHSSAAVIHYTVEHQEGMATTLAHPCRGWDLFDIGGTQIERISSG
jgi:hypothetical protein